jgi:hypothetical protein
MSANVISHQEPRRKRADAGLLTVRRIGVVIVALAGIIAASWLAPTLQGPPAKQSAASAPRSARPEAPPAGALVRIDATPDLAGAPAPRFAARRSPRRHSGVPLDASATAEPAAGYEILSAAELDGISQAANNTRE